MNEIPIEKLREGIKLGKQVLEMIREGKALGFATKNMLEEEPRVVKTIHQLQVALTIAELAIELTSKMPGTDVRIIHKVVDKKAEEAKKKDEWLSKRN